jgi:MoaA/NifB/PqqE/SkfB family radical SAM enzyme
MPDFNTLEPATSHSSFQVAWETTLKCNLDCSYCGDGHDNSQPHPSLEDSLKTVDFIVEYVNLYMSTRPKNTKSANLNIQGGESIYHPNIIEILEYARNKKHEYSDWDLHISLITNAVTSTNRWKNIVKLVDYFTISFHSEAMEKQHEMFRQNVLHLKESGKTFHVAVLMHPKHWETCISMIEWCKQHDIKAVPRQLDHYWSEFRFNYDDKQVEYITGIPKVPVTTKIISFFKNGINLSAQGRACCSGNALCTNSTEKIKYVKGNNFKGWHCSVNRFFLYIRQSTGEIYTNKDCRMNLEGKVGVIGYLQDAKRIVTDLKHKIETDTLPTIICKKSSCWCGLCSPKADTKENFNNIMKKYQI